MRKRSACQSCRRRHTKCNYSADSSENDPCEPCKQVGIDCDRSSPIHFRITTGSKGPKGTKRTTPQEWVRIPEKLQFVTSSTTDRAPNSPSPKDLNPDGGNGLNRTLSGSVPVAFASPLQTQHSRTDSSQHGSFATASLDIDARNVFQPWSPPEPANKSISHSSFHSPELLAASVHSFGGGLRANSVFQNRKEVEIFLHFTRTLAGWLDVCDSMRHFSTEVPQRALQSPLLLQSILAYTSKHFCQVNKIEDDMSADYYSRSLRLLIPVLDDPEGAMNENILAAVVVLRSYEEFSEADLGAHLLGSARLFKLISGFAITTPLGDAARWIVLRQDIYFSLTKSQPLHMELESYDTPLSPSLQGADADAYANRAVLLFAQVLNYVFGPHVGVDAQRWDDLNLEVEAWYTEMPPYFSPLWIEPLDVEKGSGFPRIYMAQQVHTVAYQHYCLCRILLAVFNPHLSQPSFENFTRRSEANETVIENLRIVIGLAIADAEAMAARFHASHILQKCGSYLRNETEQKQAIELLHDMRRIAGWETDHIIRALEWTWSRL